MSSINTDNERLVRYTHYIVSECERRFHVLSRFRRLLASVIKHSGLAVAGTSSLIAVALIAAAFLDKLWDANVIHTLAGSMVLGVMVLVLMALPIQWRQLLGRLTGARLRQRHRKQHLTPSLQTTELQFINSPALLAHVARQSQASAPEVLYWSGLALGARAECLQWVSNRQALLKRFIEQAAKGNYKLAPGDPKLHIWKRGQSFSYSASQAVGVLLKTRQLKAARSTFKEIRTLSRLDLDGQHIAQWIQTQAGRLALFDFLDGDLNARLQYLRCQLDIDWALSKAPRYRPQQANNPYAQDYMRYLEQRDDARERCQSEYEQVKYLALQLKKIVHFSDADLMSNTPAAHARLQELKRFSRNLTFYLRIEATDDKTPEELIGERLLKHMHTELEALIDSIFTAQLQDDAAQSITQQASQD